VIEGLDRSGKSTQAANIMRRLEESHHKTKLIKFPDRTTPIGKMIDAYLRSQSELDDHTIHLLFSANRWELASTIESDLASGTTILCDRYAFSGCAFTAAKGLPYDWCIAPDVGLPAPDLVLFLDISPDVAKSRGGYGEERYEKDEMQQRVRDIFKRLGDDFGSRWVTVDAGGSLETVENTIWHHLEPYTTEARHSITQLWTTETR